MSGYAGSRSGTVIKLDDGQRVQGVTIRLATDSIIAGRVLSTDGTPLVRMEVVALKKRYAADGSATLQAQGRAETDDRGEYRIAGLGPGAYYVRAAPVYSGRIALESRRADIVGAAAPLSPSPGVYAPVYYPAADHSSRAAIVQIQPGIELRNIDFALPKQETHTIRGRVFDPATGGLPARTPSIGIRPAYYEHISAWGSSIEPYRPDGSFVLMNVPRGFYWVTAQLMETPLTERQRQLLTTPGADISQLPLPVRAVALVHITDADVENVQLTFVRDLELPGRMVVEGGAFDFTASPHEFRLELRPVDAAGNGGPVGFAALNGDGTFTYKRLMPMEHRLTVSALPAGLYVKEARFGKTDAITESILLTSQPQDRLEIVLARGTEVSGRVTGSTQKPVPGQEVVLIPSTTPNRPDLYRTAITDASGHFTLHGVAPGEYDIFAWPAIERFQYFDAAFVRQFQEHATRVQVGGSPILDAAVRLIP